MSKTLEQIEDIIYNDIWADNFGAMEGKVEAIEKCTKVAQRYALEKQIELLNLFQNHMMGYGLIVWGTRKEQLLQQLKELEDGNT